MTIAEEIAEQLYLNDLTHKSDGPRVYRVVSEVLASMRKRMVEAYNQASSDGGDPSACWDIAKDVLD